MTGLAMPKYKGNQFATASNVFFNVLGNLHGLTGQIVIAERSESPTREQLDEYRADVFQQRFADRNARSEEQTN